MYIIIFQIIILFLIRNIYLCPVSNQKTKSAYNPTTLQPLLVKPSRTGVVEVVTLVKL